MKYNEVAIFDCERGSGWTATNVVRLLRDKGFKARTGHSPWVGHTAVKMNFNVLPELRRALSFLKKLGVMDEIGWRFKQIVRDLKLRADYAGYIRG